MAVPKKKTTKSARNQRRSHHALRKSTVGTCSQCQELLLPHRVCANCGTYRGKQVLEMKSQDDKSARRAKKPEDKKK